MRLIIEADNAVKEMISEEKSEMISYDYSDCQNCKDNSDPPSSDGECFNLC